MSPSAQYDGNAEDIRVTDWLQKYDKGYVLSTGKYEKC